MRPSASRRRASARVVAVIAALDLIVVVAIRVRGGGGGAGSTTVALVLAPIAVWAVAGIGARVAGPRFAAAAALVYTFLPAVARLYFYGPFVHVYRHDVLPALVGLRSPGWFAVAVAVAVVVRILPERVSGAAGAFAALVALALWVDTDWTTVYGNFHETTWSPTLISLLPFACVVAIGLRAPWLSAALGGWLAFFVLRGVHRPGEQGIWLSLAAALPAVAVLVSGLGLLVPRLRPAPAAAAAPPASAP